MAKQSDKTVLEYLYDYQTRLQGVAHDLAIQLAALALRTDEAVAKLLIKELPKKEDDVKKEMARVKKLIVALEKVRKPTYQAAKDIVLATSASVVQKATTETAKEFNKSLEAQRRATREERFCKELTDKQQSAIIDGQGIEGATIEDWLHNWERADLERISTVCKRASVESMSVADITKEVRGTKENNYSDGILAATKTSAVMIARTIINGVSNNARAETIKENADVIDGVKFIASLDGKTCPYCAPYDGQIWRGDEIASARRPPLHPNCRCTLVPYVELKDEDGNVVDVEGERPAANADFDKLAKDAYNEQAREKGWSRRWDDLSSSTRLKYYYQAQKDYEKRTGNSAYRQIPSSVSFADYFKSQPDSFKKAWLGAKRYELYQKGTIDEKTIFSPDLSYRVSTASLIRDGWKPEPLQITELAREEKENKSPVQSPVETEEKEQQPQEQETKQTPVKPQELPNAIKIPGRDQMMSGGEALDLAKLTITAKEAAYEEARKKYAAARKQEMQNLGKSRPNPGGMDLSEYERAINEFNRKQNAIMLRYDRLVDSEVAERFQSINKPLVDHLLPIDNPDSYNRRFFATLSWENLTDKLPEDCRESFNKTVRAALDYVGRIYDNLGLDAGTYFDRLRFVDSIYGQGHYDYQRKEVGISLPIFQKRDETPCQQLFEVIVHEFGHATDYNTRGAKELVQELLKGITTDENGNPTPTFHDISTNGTYHLPTINVPRAYALKEYPGGTTEMTSVFFEKLASKPVALMYDDDEIRFDTVLAPQPGSREYTFRMLEVLRESECFQTDYEALLEGRTPSDVVTLLDRYLYDIKNTQTKRELQALREKVETRLTIWAGVERDTKPKLSDCEDREELQYVTEIWEGFVRETRDKFKEVEEAIESQASVVKDFVRTEETSAKEEAEVGVNEEAETKGAEKPDEQEETKEQKEAKEPEEPEKPAEKQPQKKASVSYERVVPDFRGVKLDRIEDWKKQIKELSPSGIRALRSEIGEERDRAHDVLEKKKPKEGSAPEEQLEQLQKAWDDNYGEIVHYFFAVDKAVMEVMDENAANETIYEPILPVIRCEYGVFTPGNISSLPSILSEERASDFDAFRKLLMSRKESDLTYIEQNKKPVEEKYYWKKHFWQAEELWKKNKQEYAQFMDDLIAALDAEKERRMKEQKRYQRRPVKWGIFFADGQSGESEGIND